MKHSIKPFLLDSLLAWAKTNACTPILVVGAHPHHKLPQTLQQIFTESVPSVASVGFFEEEKNDGHWESANSFGDMFNEGQMELHLPLNLPIAFSLSDKAILNRKITTEGISFATHLFSDPDILDVFLDVGGWMSLKIKETGHVFDLGFSETLGGMIGNNQHVFEHGIVLHLPQSKTPLALNEETIDCEEMDYSFTELKTDLKNKDLKTKGTKKETPYLKLVVNNDIDNNNNNIDGDCSNQ